jgi:hypothetical protein
MTFWLRELAGWLLMLLGLCILYVCVTQLLQTQPAWFIQVVPLFIIGIVIFRGGIHLLKVSIAARVCLRVHRAQQLGEKARPAVVQPNPPTI